MSTYLIIQATGRQAQYTIQHLLDAGAKIHALVRDPAKIPSILQSPGVTVFKGETVDFDAVFKAAEGCKGMFLNTFPIPGVEAKQAETAVAAAKKAGIETVVAATTIHTGNRAMWDTEQVKQIGLHDYYTSKSAVEDAVRNGGFKAYTIVRPGFIHFDYTIPHVYGNYPTLPTAGELAHVYEPGARLQHTDGNDIGKYASAALLNPDKFGGEEIELGNENLTVEEARDILVKVSGRQVAVRTITPEELEEGKIKVFAQAFQRWSNVTDTSHMERVAKEVQSKYGIPFTSLEEALQRDKAQLLECIPANV